MQVVLFNGCKMAVVVVVLVVVVAVVVVVHSEP